MAGGHDHAHGTDDRRRLGIALAIVVVVLAVEIVGGVVSGALVLLADAGHMLADAVGLTVALVAAAVARRPPTDRHTYGFRRMEVLGALVNAVILTAVGVGVAIEGVSRLVDPPRSGVQGGLLLAVAALGLLANLAAFAVLRGGDRGSIGMRGALLEVLGDLLGSIAALVAGVVILVTGWMPADAVASLVVAALILPRAALLMRDVAHVLTESAPRDTDVAEIREHLLTNTGVLAVHDVHVWSITSGSPVFSAHIVVEPDLLAEGGSGRLLERMNECLADHFDVGHSTFQLEPADHDVAGHPAHR
jgi:cobalt-zinc-cadmium efflux system protein